MASNIIPFPRQPANDDGSDPDPHQPGLRAFIVYDRLLPGTIAFHVADNCMTPHLRAGDIAIVDASDREPMHGELFLIKWMSGREQVVEVGLFHKSSSRDGGRLWNAIWKQTLTAMDGSAPETMRWGDGPYYEPDFQEKLVGRVVGILDAAFEEPRRLAA